MLKFNIPVQQQKDIVKQVLATLIEENPHYRLIVQYFMHQNQALKNFLGKSPNTVSQTDDDDTTDKDDDDDDTTDKDDDNATMDSDEDDATDTDNDDDETMTDNDGDEDEDS